MSHRDTPGPDPRPDLEWPAEDLQQTRHPLTHEDLEHWPAEDPSRARPPAATEPGPPPPAAWPPVAPEPPAAPHQPIETLPGSPPVPPVPPATSPVPSVPPGYQPPPPPQMAPPQMAPPPLAPPPLPAPPFAIVPPAPFRGPAPISSPTAPGPYALPGAPGPKGRPEAAPGAPADGEARAHFRPDIEGLRAVAVIAVLLYHVGLSGAAGGFVGVDVFYVISGFLITGLLLREGQASGKVDLVSFYARRMRRLLPAALVVIVATLAASAVVLSPLRLTEVAGDAAAAALYVSNFRFALEATDYLAIGAPSPFLHYWSLGVEEQFYLAWPLILLIGARFLRLRFLGPGILVLAVASFGLSLYWTSASPSWAFFSPFTRTWELAAGALLAVGLLRMPRRVPRGLPSLVVALGLALIVAGVVAIDDQTPFPGLSVLLPVVGTVLVIMGGGPGPTLVGRLLSNRLARYIGRISYSLYLWHWPILVLGPIAIGRDDLGLRLALAGLALVVAMVSTEVIEQPFRRASLLSRRPRGTVRLGLVTSFAVGVAALVMTGTINIPIPWTQQDPVIVQLAGVRDDLPASYADGCHINDYQARRPADCTYGDPEGTRTAVLYGDSHAAQWLPALDRYARERGWRLEYHTKAACSPVPLPFWERTLRRVYDECFEWREAVLRRIAKGAPDVVFVGSSRDYELLDGGVLVQTRDVYPLWRQGLTEAITALDAAAGRVVLLAETPFINYDPVDCLADPKVSGCDPPRRAVVDAEYAAVEAAAAEAGGADVVSINDLLCPGTTCPVQVEGTVVFRDPHHVTATYMALLTEPIANLLEGRAPYPSPSPSDAVGRSPSSSDSVGPSPSVMRADPAASAPAGE